MVKIPDGDEYRRRWSQLAASDRRRIMRAVNRGETLDDPRDAAMAVGAARNQQRFWKRAWVIGPFAALLVLLQPSNRTVVAYLLNAVLGTAILALMSVFWYRRAVRAEQANLERATTASRRRRPRARSKDGSHLPRSRRRR